jgi:hypothetical protein
LLQKKCVFMATAILIIYIYVVFTLLLMIYPSKAMLDFFGPAANYQSGFTCVAHLYCCNLGSC